MTVRGFGFAALALLAIPAAAQVPAVWTRTAAPDASFSVETPCTEAQLQALRGAPDTLKGVPLPADSRVLCLTDQMLFMAGTVEAPSAELQSEGLFDQIMAAAKADPSAKGTPTMTTVDGHRAFLNREIQGEIVAQTGVIEASRSSIILLVAGGQPGGTRSAADQIAAIERHVASIKVGGR